MFYKKSLILSLIIQTLVLVGCSSSKDVDALFTGSPTPSPSPINSGDELGNSALSFSPAVYDFGSIRANSDSKETDIVVENKSKQPVYVSSVGGGNSNFDVSSHDCPISPKAFDSKAKCTAKVKFTPKVGGNLSMALLVSYGADPSKFSFSSSGSLTGTGVTPLSFAGVESIDQVKAKSMRLNWTANSDAGGYLIFKVNGDGSVTMVGSTSGSNSSFTVPSLTENTSYTFKVGATDKLGVYADNSVTATATTAAAPTFSAKSNFTFPTSYLTQGVATAPVFDYDNARTSSDANMSYTCVFDTTVDDAVTSSTDCTALPGTATFNTSTGVLNWTPNTSAYGPYELKITGTLYGESSVSDIVALAVREAYPSSNLVASFDGRFANLISLNLNSPFSTTWKNLTSVSGMDGILSNNTWSGTAWGGDGTVGNPYGLTFTSAQSNIVTSGTALDSYADLVFATWIKPSSVSTLGSVIFGNGGGTSSGFVLKQSDKIAGKLEVAVGNSATTYDALVSALSPRAYWRLNETSGTSIADSSGNSNTGTATANVTLNQSGYLSGWVSSRFTGSSSYISVPNSATLGITGDLSIAVWVYPESSTGYQGIVAKGQGTGGVYPYLLAFDNGTLYPTIYISGANATWGNRATTAATLNQWNHIGITFESATKKLTYYVNGSAAGSYTVGGGTISTNTDPVEIGTMIANGYPLTGKLDEPAIFASALSATQMADLYYIGKTCMSSATLTNNTWYHIGGYHDSTSGNTKLYVNGQLQCTTSFGVAINPGNTALVLGGKSNGSNPWAGTMAETRFYSSGNATTITDNYYANYKRYRSTPSVVSSDLILHMDAAYGDGSAYPGSGCSVTSWNDLSTSGFVGTLTNFSSCGATSGWNGTGPAVDPYRVEVNTATGDYVSVPDSAGLRISGDLTVMVFIKPTGANGNYQGIVGKGTTSPYGYLLAFNSGTTTPTLYLDGANATWANTATTSLTAGTWASVAATFTSSTKALKYYLNGALDGTHTVGGSTINTNTAAFEIGSMVGNAYPFQGAIAAVLIYNNDLTITEIKQNCQAYESRLSGLSCAP